MKRHHDIPRPRACIAAACPAAERRSRPATLGRVLCAWLLAMLLPAAASTVDPESVPGSPPRLHTGIVVCDDNSAWHGFSFQARLGLLYTIETSADLQTWDVHSTVYGTGHRETVLLREAPPVSTPPPSGAPPAPAPVLPRVQLLMRQATGGGVVLSWQSLADQSPQIHHFPLLEPDPGWTTLPFYWARHAGHAFFIAHTYGNVTDPPAVNPPHPAADAAMLADFEASFDDINDEVAASVERAATIPAEPPPPSEKSFARVRVAWDYDSDGDLIPDWIEWQWMSDPDPDVAQYGGPFDPDADGDGIADGGQATGPGSNLVWSDRASQDDPAIDWKRAPDYRYAVFPVDPPLDYHGSPVAPLQIDSHGRVLFRSHQWIAGQLKELQGSEPRAFASNSAGNILGTALIDGGTPVVWWKSIDDAPVVVSEGTLHPHSPGFLIKGGAAWGDTFSDDGEFVAQTWEDAEDSQTPFPPPGLWKINPQTGATSREETEYVFSRVKAPGLVFGPNLEEEFVHFGPPAHNFGKNVFYCNLTKMSSGSLVVTCGPDVRRSRPRISKGGWQEIPTLSAIWDISSEGVAIVEHEVWNNGVTRAWKDVAPDLPQNLHPVTLRQISDRGHILGGEFQSSGSRVFAAFPIGLKDDAEGRGVDVTTAASKEEAWRGDHRLWAMVPKGSGVSNELEILSGATAVSPLKLSAPGVRFNGEEELTVTQSPFAVSLSAAGDAPDSGESLLEVKLGTAANEVISASKPIGFKFMKPRTVKVALIPVALEREVGGIYSPTLTPTADELRDKLHEIYRPQLNTTFAVTLMSELTVKWDLNNDRRLDVIDGAISAEQHAILNTPGANPDNFDIRIFVVGGPSPDEAGLFDMWGSFLASEELDGLDAFVVGWTLNVQADMNTCFVTGVQIKVNGVDRTKEKVILTSVHEVGHVFTGVGHPDNEEGIAPLLGTDRTRRVLASGYSERTDPGKLLVKTEWDKAEGWLIRVIDGNNQ